MVRRIGWVAMALLCGVPARGFGAGWSEHWAASSRTASAITGDVTLLSDRIVFAGGQPPGASLPIARAKNVMFKDDIGITSPATIYRVTKPADPPLLGGNRLCGGQEAKPVTYLVIWWTKPVLPGEATGRALAAFTGPAIPDPDANHTCAVFRYDLIKVASHA